MTNKNTVGDYPIWSSGTLPTIYETVPSSFSFSNSAEDILNSLDIEKLWDKMYNNAKKMWVVCGYCNSANALGSPTCCQCGGDLGDKYK